MDCTQKDSLLQTHRNLEEAMVFRGQLDRKKSVALLWFGAIMGLLGFFFAFLIGMYTFWNPLLGKKGSSFPSGEGYFPSTVSEMVHDPKTPAGKCFFAFEMVGAILIFLSWYPYELRSVYIGDSAIAACNISWVMIRQFIPTVGMMLVATVTTTPIAEATVVDYYCIGIHLTGAVMLFAGYVVVEGITLGWGPFSRPEVTHRTIGDREHWWRCRCLDFIAVWYTVFCVLQVVLVLPMETSDKWSVVNIRDPPVGSTGSVSDNLTYIQKTVLVDTASGACLFLKILSYSSEVLCGLGLICSFLTIWYYSEERHADLMDELVKTE
jgi:hypothetical protein|eukprot:TRINITY_DN50486_c0_g1_i1.p1 TRINITY_DN50486_c0_g1~~TRINITY_DN50486_c0_g1_i1.p1  ORF type:complete len:323 (-),score=40.30 TRINITY_DN50486_c0_g1_i1:216-1184(-)